MASKSELVCCVCVCVVLDGMCLGVSCMCGNYYNRGGAQAEVTWDTWTEKDGEGVVNADEASLVTCTHTHETHR